MLTTSTSKIIIFLYSCSFSFVLSLLDRRVHFVRQCNYHSATSTTLRTISLQQFTSKGTHKSLCDHHHRPIRLTLLAFTLPNATCFVSYIRIKRDSMLLAVCLHKNILYPPYLRTHLKRATHPHPNQTHVCLHEHTHTHHTYLAVPINVSE